MSLQRTTALFFDLENVVRGYGEGLGQRAAAFSFRELEESLSTGAGDAVGLYAVKRAYADWSMHGLKVLRKDLIEHGVESRQVFGFGDGGKKNAADVELVIDVLEVAYLRPEVTTFVIVSGDGGFGSLVRKLHELGKFVVVAGYEDRSSKALQAICDSFIVLPSPLDAVPAERLVGPARAGVRTSPRPMSSAAGASLGLPERLLNAVASVPTAPVRDKGELVSVGRALLAEIAENAEIDGLLRADGIPVSSVAKAAYHFVDGEAVRQHHGTFSAFLRAAIEGTELTIGKDGTAAAKLYRLLDGGETTIARPANLAGASALSEGQDDGRAAQAQADAAEVQDVVRNADPRTFPQRLRPILARLVDEGPDQRIPITALLTRWGGTGLKERLRASFGTASAFLRVTFAETPYCLAHVEGIPSTLYAAVRGGVESDPNWRVLSDIPTPSDATMTRRILAADGVVLSDDPLDTIDIARAIEKQPLTDGESVSEVVSRLIEREALPVEVELPAIRDTLRAFAEVGVLSGGVEEGWYEAPRRQEVARAESMIQALRDTAATVLRSAHLDPALALDQVILPWEDTPALTEAGYPDWIES